MILDERELFDIFSGLSTAVMAVRAERVIYANDAAKELMGEDVTGAQAELLLEAESSGTDWTRAAGEIRTKGGTAPATLRRLEDMVLVTVVAKSEPDEGMRALSASITDAVWNHLSICALATDLVMARARESSDVTSLTYLSMIDRAVHGIARVTNNSARVFNGLDGSHKPVPLDLGGLVGDLVNTTAVLIRQKEVELKYVPPRRKVAYWADPEKTELMLMELLSNSIGHTRPGGKITVSLRFAASGVLITVADTGEGIRSGVLGNIFSRYRSARAGGGTSVGAGFGLGIAQSIANAHGGRIIIESSRHSGACVTVSLPASGLVGDDTELREDVPRSPISTFLTEYADVLESSVYLDKDDM